MINEKCDRDAEGKKTKTNMGKELEERGRKAKNNKKKRDRKVIKTVPNLKRKDRRKGRRKWYI